MLAALAVVRHAETNHNEFGAHNLVVDAQAGPHIGSCPVFPRDNIWNTPIDKLPKHPKSDAYIQSIGPAAKLHPDFGGGTYGEPINMITAETPPAKVTFRYAAESDPGPYPIPEGAGIEGGPNSDGDSHIFIIDPRTCKLYEIWLAHQTGPGQWTAGCGAIFDLKSNDLRPAGWTSADAAGLPMFPGLVRYDEIQAGEIDHALRFTIPHTQAAYIWPGRHKASSNTSPNVPPMGLRFRLRADFDISGFSLTNRIILTALKKYGMFLADNGGAIFVQGTQSDRWNTDDLHKLTGVTAADFEAVDESGLQKSANSAAVNPAALKF
jgi:hypothetical protein